MNKIILSTAMLTISLSAANIIQLDNGVKLDANKDDNNKIHPDIVLPIKYNSSLSSSIEYRTDTTITENEKVLNVMTSDKDTTIDHSLLKVNILNYNVGDSDSKYYFGIGIQNEDFEKSQIGYATSGVTNLNFDHKMDIKVQSVFLRTQATFYSDFINSKINLLVVPTSKLKVTQNTTLTGTTSSTGTGSSEETLDMSYEVALDMMSSSDSLIKFGLEGRYKFLPLKYNLQLANSDNTYTPTKYDVEEKITYLAGKIYLNAKLFGGFMPTLGFSNEKTSGTNKIDNTTYEITKNNLIFGFNTKF